MIARMPLVDLLGSEGFEAVEAKMMEVFRKASLVASGEEHRPSS